MSQSIQSMMFCGVLTLIFLVVTDELPPSLNLQMSNCRHIPVDKVFTDDDCDGSSKVSHVAMSDVDEILKLDIAT